MSLLLCDPRKRKTIGSSSGAGGGSSRKKYYLSSALLLVFLLFVINVVNQVVLPDLTFITSTTMETARITMTMATTRTGPEAVERARNNLPHSAKHEVKDNRSMKFKESALAHKYLDRLSGIEIGASAHNGFGLNTINVDYTADSTVFTKEQIKLCGKYRRVDVVALGDDLPFGNDSVDFVVSSHAIEHFYDPIKSLCEWARVVRPDGYILTVAPHKQRTFDKQNKRTTLAQLVERHHTPLEGPDAHGHWSIWETDDFIKLCEHLGLTVVDFLDKDDKVGNGFMVLNQVTASFKAQCLSSSFLK